MKYVWAHRNMEAICVVVSTCWVYPPSASHCCVQILSAELRASYHKPRAFRSRCVGRCIVTSVFICNCLYEMSVSGLIGVMDTLGIEPRASRMLSGCDTTTPCALESSRTYLNVEITRRPTRTHAGRGAGLFIECHRSHFGSRYKLG